ncbi:MAG: endolytic transglycosylase MltG [Alicyclobacillus sp.]|nr:endolytic transglycosylase MltG [Alicyclobacillus sp.]
MHDLEDKTSRSKRRWVWWVAAVGAAVVLAVAVCGVWLYSAYQPPTAAGRGQTRIVVRSGESVAQLAGDLERSGLIRSAFVFQLYVRWKGVGSRLQAGTYAISPGSRVSEIVSQMTHGDVVPETVTVTVPEGFTVIEIADRLQAAGVCSKSAFLEQVQTGHFDEPFVHTLPSNPDIKYRFEGYLFPDTYDFVRQESAHEVVDTMLQDFQRHIDAAGIPEALQKQGESLPELITIASMVEREAKIQSDRPLIASVIYNRLHLGMKLQIDATIQYILGHVDIVTDKDLQVQDPYNTYLHAGLPPGPIGSPGMASILAALHPAKTDYLYYVAKYDGSGGSYFSATEAQHLLDIQKSQANLRAHGGQ